MTTEIVHFVVTGEFITATARRFWNEEDEPERALALLEEVVGLSEAQRMDILRGKQKLTGDSSAGIGIAPDKAKGKSLKQVVKKLKAERDEARAKAADLTQLVTGETEALASPTGLRRVPRRKTERRTVKGATRTVMVKDREFDDLLADPEVPKEGRGAKPQRIWQQIEPLAPSYYGPSQERQEKEEQEEEAERAAARQALPEHDVIAGDSGWVSPEGKFYPAGYARHAYVAWALGLTDNPQNHAVEPAGWVRVSPNDGKVYHFGEHSLFTPVQNDLIRAHCKAIGQELPFWLEES